MILPTIHLNGTSGMSLLTQIREAHRAVDKALKALYGMAPHARDYYPQGDDAFVQATTEHSARLERLRSVAEELDALYNGIADIQRGNR